MRNVRKVFLQIIFTGFPFILISYIILYSVSANGPDLSDIISAIYLFLALYYVINYRKLFT